MNEFGRICERRKLRMNVGKSKVMRWSRYGNWGRMHVIIKGNPWGKWSVLSNWGRE